MITISPVITMPTMKRLAACSFLLVIGACGGLRAQDAAAAAPAAPTTPAAAPDASAAAASPAPAQLTPPPDAAAPTAPAMAPAPDASPAAAPAPAPATSTSSKMTRDEIIGVRKQEVVRRQELIYRSDESMKAARKAEVGSDFPDARKGYLFSAEAYGSVSRATSSYATAAEGLTRVDFQLYDDALKAGDTARAKLLITEVIKYNPNNKEASLRLAAIERAMANPNDTSLLGNPAVTPKFVAKVNLVQQLFAEAEQFRRTGQWDEATARLRHILAIDPYNIAASKQLERIDDQRNKYDDTARLETREERLRQVEEKWYEQINNDTAGSTAQEGQPTLTAATNFNLDQRLRTIFLSLDFNNATIEEATNFLSIESKRLDPEHKGLNFIIQPEASTSAKPVSVTLNNVPLGEALRYVCQLANVKYKVQDYAISIVPFTSRTDDLISRTFNVLPSFVAAPSGTGVVASATDSVINGARPIPTAAGAAVAPSDPSSGDIVRTALIAKGVKFPPGASAVYTPSTGQLTVVDTPDQIELLEELVNAGLAPTLMVRIATKFVEINQTDLNDLTINTGFNIFNNTGYTVGVHTPQFATQFPGANAFAPNSIDQLIAPQSILSNTISIRSIVAAPAQINVLVQALAQKKSFDLLSEPAVLTKSGEQGVLEAVRVFPYPISFDPPQLVTQTGTAGTTITTTSTFTPPTVIATTPTDFKRRNVGVRLVVKPQVTADNRTIDLSLFPEVTDFEGFVNYGAAINIANPDGTFSLLSSNQINQPVFNTRRINTKVLIRDNSTVVLGGLIRDDVQNINDKVPFLGDLPLIGRLFQSKAVTNTKRNLIIFVTANIYQNDGELLNPPENTHTADILTGRAGFAPVTTP